MKKRFVKIAGLITSAALLAVMTGCSPEKTGVSATKTESIRVWTNDAHSKELIIQMVSDYNNTIGKEEGIQIEYTVYGENYGQILEMSMANGEVAEIYKTVGSLRTLVHKGGLLPLEELPGMEGFLKSYADNIRPEINSIDGKTYRVPFGSITLGLVYNKDLFKEAGLVDRTGEALPPKTWDEAREYAKKLTNSSKKVYGIALPIKWNDFFTWDLVSPFRASLETLEYDYVAGKYDYMVNKPIFQWLLGVKADKSFFPGAEGLDNDAARAQFAEGRVAMIMGASFRGLGPCAGACFGRWEQIQAKRGIQPSAVGL